MKQIKAKRATPESLRKYGVVTRLTDNTCFQGEGWKCWMTDGDCMDQPAHFGMTYVKTYPPYSVTAMERHTKTRELMVCGNDRPIVVALAASDPAGHAQAEDVEAFILEPGEILVIDKGIWHDACRALDCATHYYFFSLETDEPAVFQPLDNGPVEIVL